MSGGSSRTYSLPEWNDHGTLRIDRQVSFVSLFQEALTKRGVLEETQQIPTFAAKSQYILHPRGTLLRVWWLIMLPVIAVMAIIVPYQVAFETSDLNTMFILQRVIDLFFLLDMAIQFHSAYFDDNTGRLVTDPAAIRHNYVKSTFALDLVGMIPYDVFAITLEGPIDEVRFFRVLRMMKLVRLLRLQSLIVNFELDYNLNHNKLTIFKFLIGIVYLTHMMACIFVFITVVEDAPRNWLTENEYNHAQALTQYTVALYYAAAMVSSVGYGPLAAVTPAEQSFAVLCLFIGCMVYAFVVTTGVNIYINMERDVNEHKRTMNDVNDFLEVHQLPVSLQVLVRQFFLQQHRYKSARQIRQEQLLRRMSPELRGLCARRMHEKWFAELPFLTPLDNQLLANVFLNLRLQTYIPRERIFDHDDLAESLFIIRRGAVFVRSKLFTVGKCFGEEMILNRFAKRGYSAHALQFVETYVLSRSDLYDVLDGHPAITRLVRKGAIRMRFRRSIVKTLAKMRAERQTRHILDTFQNADTPRTRAPFSKATPGPTTRKSTSPVPILNASTEISLEAANEELKGASMQDVLQFLVDELADIRRILRDAVNKDVQPR